MLNKINQNVIHTITNRISRSIDKTAKYKRIKFYLIPFLVTSIASRRRLLLASRFFL